MLFLFSPEPEDGPSIHGLSTSSKASVGETFPLCFSLFQLCNYQNANSSLCLHSAVAAGFMVLRCLHFLFCLAKNSTWTNTRHKGQLCEVSVMSERILHFFDSRYVSFDDTSHLLTCWRNCLSEFRASLQQHFFLKQKLLRSLFGMHLAKHTLIVSPWKELL